MADKLDKDGNIITEEGSGAGGDKGNSDGDEGTGGNKAGGNGQNEGALTKEDIQGIVKESIELAVKDIITPELDRRISGATKTIYKKVGVKDEGDGNNQNQSANTGAVAEARELANRREMVQVYAEAGLKEELGKLEPEVQAIVDKLLPLEIAGIEFEEGVSNKDHAAKATASLAKTIKAMQGKIESAKVEALKKAGQVTEVGAGGGTKPNPGEDFEAGKKLAETRHPKKK